ncbi:two-component sensor histidine kinase [Streptomyces tauricus]|uniref:histidine kinase n=1 Tax=Streptomyces tauricus TaxID=68274 RepID=A0ABZ1JIA4_9ACTN|nr:HAMP domain-containing sensor histidine kinase [Streptomyces tauricus]MCW8097841.1 HAMP domain-containing histidine kinase [Streptomyces tauricus]GHA32922.1 two-component sensor histidine kinase [Streptomyces tauricus]
MRRRMRSVRARATLAATLVVAVALVAAGAAVLFALRASLIGQADTEADSVARNAASALSNGFAYNDLDLPDGDENPVEVLDRKGKAVASGEDVEGMSVVAKESQRLNSVANDDAGDTDEGVADEEDALEAGDIADETWYGEGTATVEGETDDYRFAGVDVVTKGGVPLTVYAGAPLSAEQGAVGTALTAMLIGLPLLLVTVSGVTYVVTRRALRPVEGIRAEMAAITASEDLSRRVPEPGTHDEIARLARTTNQTLAALEASVERQRAFVADASHELRSPIASLRTQLEVGAAHPELLDVEGAVEDTVRLQRLAADLLLLARLDAGERSADARFDLAALVRTEAGKRAGDRVDVSVDAEAVEVSGSRGQLARVLGNLLDNAQRHTRSSVAVRVRRVGDWAVLEVADDGEGVPAGERERVFERFVRLDEARARDDGGAGLGLAIARDVAVRHGGTLGVREAAGGGALFELRLPAPLGER